MRKRKFRYLTLARIKKYVLTYQKIKTSLFNKTNEFRNDSTTLKETRRANNEKRIKIGIKVIVAPSPERQMKHKKR